MQRLLDGQLQVQRCCSASSASHKATHEAGCGPTRRAQMGSAQDAFRPTMYGGAVETPLLKHTHTHTHLNAKSHAQRHRPAGCRFKPRRRVNLFGDLFTIPCQKGCLNKKCSQNLTPTPQRTLPEQAPNPFSCSLLGGQTSFAAPLVGAHRWKLRISKALGSSKKLSAPASVRTQIFMPASGLVSEVSG